MHLSRANHRQKNTISRRKGSKNTLGVTKRFTTTSGESQFLELMDMSAQGVLIQSYDSSPLFVNQAFARGLGYGVDDLLNLGSLECLYSMRELLRLRSYCKKAAFKYTYKKSSAFCEVEVRHKLGFDVILQYSISHVNWLGTPALLIFSADVTEKNLSRQALSLSEERFRDFAESATDWCWELDNQLRVVYVSDNFERITGFKKSSILGK